MHGLLRIRGMQPILLGDHKNIRNPQSFPQSFLQCGSGMPVLFTQRYNNSSPKTTVNMIKASGTPSPGQKDARFTRHTEIRIFLVLHAR